MSDTSLRGAEGVILSALVASFVLLYAIGRLRRRRPDLRILTPIAVGVVLRILVVIAVNASGSAATLRGGDETTFLDLAKVVAGTPWGRGFLPHGPYQLQTELFAAQIKLLAFTPTALRMTQIAIAMLGLILIIASVHDLAGPRAARLLAWLLALEPANLFFNSEIHKEPLMVLASGLVVFGSTKLWRRLDLMGLIPCALGSLIGIETRSYAGWFLVAAWVLLLFHAALRRLDRPLIAIPIIYLLVAVAVVTAPILLRVTSRQSLATLQAAQDYTTQTQTATAASTSGNGDNLALEQVDFSTRGAVLANLPGRMLDLIVRPYPWQLADISQRLGAVATMLALIGLALLARYAWLIRRGLLDVIAPLAYPALFLLVAYSLSAGNAGTGFRYRSHIVILGAAMLAAVRERALSARAGAAVPVAERSPARRELTPA